MTIRIGINGFGRIGRSIFRAAKADPIFSDMKIVAVNDPATPEILAHLLRYDSVMGPMKNRMAMAGNLLEVDGQQTAFHTEPEPGLVPWHRHGVEFVVESSGRFANLDAASRHLQGGARRVVITAPAKGEAKTIVMGINEDEYDPGRDRVVSNASCTTHCLAPVARVILDRFGLRRGLISTIHSYTNDQRLLDSPHNDLRRARAAGLSIIPTTTGAAAAIGLVIPELTGRFDGMSVRVPTANVSLVDVVMEVERPCTTDSVNQALQESVNRYMGFTMEPLVSTDYREDTRSSIVDGLSTRVIETTVKVMSWYNNEWGYANRVLDLIRHMHLMEL
ncbi:MAG: type I glyceraldehyde-3-phosphate dehydrogenase [Magnetococcales bacterium]|nr:type I glyceraldehyde-3-phosphate dehydrogenase [Magnetococcales bacterium]